MEEDFERQRNRQMNAGAPRDAYGFEIKREYRQLYDRFLPVWKEEETERCKLWEQFFTEECKDSFGLPGSADAVVSAMLRQFDMDNCDNNDSYLGVNAAVARQLQSLVQAGVPMASRGKYWQLFLKADRKRKPGLYHDLVTRALEHSPVASSASTASCSEELEGSTALAAHGATAAFVKQPNLGGVKSLGVPVVEILANSSSSRDPAAQQHTTWTIAPAELRHQCIATEASAGTCSNPDAPANSGEPGSAAALSANQMLETKLLSRAEHGISDVLATPLSGLLWSCSDSSDAGSAGSWRSKDWLGQIEKDLHRTFPGHPLMDTSGRAVLRRILAAYARHNPAVGYCQGMNFIAACFMLFMEEEEAFWCLAAVVEDLLPGYFDTRMVAPQVDQKVFAHLLQASFPTVMKHLEALEVDVSSVTMHWFLVLFVNSLPLESCLRVWDLLFFEGSPLLLFRVALALVDIYHKALLECRECSDAYMLLQSMGPMSFDGSRLVDTACSGFGHIKDSALQVLRAKYRPEVLEQMRSSFVSDEEFRRYAYYGAAAEPTQSRSQSLSSASARGGRAAPRGADAGHLTSGSVSCEEGGQQASDAESISPGDTWEAAGERQVVSDACGGKGAAAASRLLPAAKQAMSALTARLVPSSLPPLLPSGAVGARGEELPAQQGALATVKEKLAVQRRRIGGLVGRDRQGSSRTASPCDSSDAAGEGGQQEATAGTSSSGGDASDVLEGVGPPPLRVVAGRDPWGGSPGTARHRQVITPFLDPLAALQGAPAGWNTSEPSLAEPDAEHSLDLELTWQGGAGGGTSSSAHPAGNAGSDGTQAAAAALDALDFRSPVKPPPRQCPPQLQPLGRHRRTQSEIPWSHAAAAGQASGQRPRSRRRRSFLPDLHRLAVFVPDFRQPAVVAAYQIAANPSPRHPALSSSLSGHAAGGACPTRPYSRTPLSSVWGAQGGGECVQFNQQRPALAQNPLGAAGVGPPPEAADPVRVLQFEVADVEEGGRPMGGDASPQSPVGVDGESSGLELPEIGGRWSTPLGRPCAAAPVLDSRQEGLPLRRFTDGDAAIGESLSWAEGDDDTDADAGTGVLPIRPPRATTSPSASVAAEDGEGEAECRPGGGGSPAATPPSSTVTPAGPSTRGSTRLATSPGPGTCSQLLALVARLQEEVATAESRRHAAEMAAQQAQETAEQLRRQLRKLQQDAASKGHVVGDLEEQVAVVSGELGDAEGELCAGKMAGDALQQQIAQHVRELATKDELIRLLMSRVHR